MKVRKKKGKNNRSLTQLKGNIKKKQENLATNTNYQTHKHTRNPKQRFLLQNKKKPTPRNGTKSDNVRKNDTK